MHNGELLLTVNIPDNVYNQWCCFSPCGKFLSSIGADGKTLNLHSVAGATDGAHVGTTRLIFQDGDGDDENNVSASTLCFSPHDTLIAVGSSWGDVQLYDSPALRRNGPLLRTGNGDIAVLALSFSGAGGETLVAASNAVEVYDVASRQLRHTFAADWQWIDMCSAGAVGGVSQVATCAGEAGQGTLVWDVATGSTVLELPPSPDGTRQSTHWLPGGVLATVSQRGFLLMRLRRRCWGRGCRCPAPSAARRAQHLRWRRSHARVPERFGLGLLRVWAPHRCVRS